MSLVELTIAGFEKAISAVERLARKGELRNYTAVANLIGQLKLAEFIDCESEVKISHATLEGLQLRVHNAVAIQVNHEKLAKLEAKGAAI